MPSASIRATTSADDPAGNMTTSSKGFALLFDAWAKALKEPRLSSTPKKKVNNLFRDEWMFMFKFS